MRFTKRFKDLTGQQFARWKVIKLMPDRTWLCVCQCGAERTVRSDSLRTANSRSCGCLRKEVVARTPYRHGGAIGRILSREFRAYRGILNRCRNKRDAQYFRYGGRGIKVCKRWLESFKYFLQDMWKCPSNKHTLDRWPDNNGNYEPKNCRWATMKQQCNNRRSSKFITVDCVSKTIAEWADHTGISQDAIGRRILRGWHPKLAISKATRKRR